MDLDSIYKQLLENGFYDNIYIDYCEIHSNNNSISIPRDCENRLSLITEYGNIYGFKLYSIPCRIGRKSKYCGKKIKDCKIINNDILCPLCSILNKDNISPCKPLNNIIRIDINGYVIIPNAYPYLEKQFLITSYEHISQIDMINNLDALYRLFTVFNSILIKPEDVIFFNGMCGNSLEHFHCQYTVSKFPIFDIILDNQQGFFENNKFKGYIIIIKDNIEDFHNIIKRIEENNLTYNFICRGVTDGIQLILFIRKCKIENSVKDLSLGAPELSGIIVSETKENLDTFPDEITAYLNETHRKSDYNVCFPTLGGKKKSRSRKTRSRKNRKSRKREAE